MSRTIFIDEPVKVIRRYEYLVSDDVSDEEIISHLKNVRHRFYLFFDENYEETMSEVNSEYLWDTEDCDDESEIYFIDEENDIEKII